MMQLNENVWSQKEKEIAEKALAIAYERETKALIEDMRAKLSGIAKLDDVWNLHDFLSAKRHEIDGKYDNRDSVLVFVFANLLKEGWLNLDELQDLDREKVTKIAVLSKM